MRRGLLALALALAVACLHEDPTPPTTTLCDPAAADCTVCKTASDCHNGTANGYGPEGWRCVEGHCAKADCDTDSDCSCSGSTFSNGWCKEGACYCTQCLRDSQCKSTKGCLDNRCGCAVDSDCGYGCGHGGVCKADGKCACYQK